MSPPDDTNPSRGRPVLKRVQSELPDIWQFVGFYKGGSAERAADAAQADHGNGLYKVLPSGSWPDVYLRD